MNSPILKKTRLLPEPYSYESPTLIDNLPLRNPYYNGRPVVIRTFRYNGHPAYRNPAIANKPLLWIPRYYGSPATTDTPLLRRPRYDSNPVLTYTMLFTEY